MTINISEELPARKHAPVADKKEGGEKPAAKGGEKLLPRVKNLLLVRRKRTLLSEFVKQCMTFAIVPEEKILI